MTSVSTLFSIKVSRHVTVILLLFVVATKVRAQQDEYFSFKPAGIEGNQIKVIPQGKTVKVLATGGYVQIEVSKALRIAESLILRTYFKSKSVEKTVDHPFDAAIYLAPENDFYIDLLDIKSNSLVKRYILQRPKLFPIILFNDENNRPLYTSKEEGKAGVFRLPPGKKVTLTFKQRLDYEAMDIEYTLRDLKTGRTQQGTDKYAIKDIDFETNTYYELRLNYVDQRESTAVISIYAEPYWYQSRNTLALLMFAVFVFSIISFVRKINTSRKERRKLEQAAIRLQSLLNPHFTFNALSSIQGLMNTNRIDEANQYLEEFSSLLRQTLATSRQVYNTLDKELEMMRLYIKLEAFRFNFSWTLEIAEELHLSEIEIPTLLLQPLIENAIKHGIGNLGDQGRLIITCKESTKKDTFVIVIKDNGTWVDQKEHSGYGLSLTRERIDTINKMNRHQSIALTFDKVEGTEAILTFKNWI